MRWIRPPPLTETRPHLKSWIVAGLCDVIVIDCVAQGLLCVFAFSAVSKKYRTVVSYNREAKGSLLSLSVGKALPV